MSLCTVAVGALGAERHFFQRRLTSISARSFFCGRHRQSFVIQRQKATKSSKICLNVFPTPRSVMESTDAQVLLVRIPTSLSEIRDSNSRSLGTITRDMSIIYYSQSLLSTHVFSTACPHVPQRVVCVEDRVQAPKTNSGSVIPHTVAAPAKHLRCAVTAVKIMAARSTENLQSHDSRRTW